MSRCLQQCREGSPRRLQRHHGCSQLHFRCVAACSRITPGYQAITAEGESRFRRGQPCNASLRLSSLSALGEILMFVLFVWWCMMYHVWFVWSSCISYTYLRHDLWLVRAVPKTTNGWGCFGLFSNSGYQFWWSMILRNTPMKQWHCVSLFVWSCWAKKLEGKSSIQE